MKLKSVLIAALIALLGVSVAAAQQDCGSGLPCGPVPWRLPNLPPLASPTPMPTEIVTDQSGSVATEEPPPSIDITAPDLDDVNNQVATLTAIVSAPQDCVIDLDGENCVEVTPEALADNALMIFGYVRGLGSSNFGFLTPLVVFLLGAFTIGLSVKTLLWLLPVLTAAWGLIRKVISLILDFLPL